MYVLQTAYGVSQTHLLNLWWWFIGLLYFNVPVM